MVVHKVEDEVEAKAKNEEEVAEVIVVVGAVVVVGEEEVAINPTMRSQANNHQDQEGMEAMVQ